MKLSKLKATHFRSLRNVEIELDDINLFIGANAAGKSTILDAMRFLHEAVLAHDFRGPAFARGGFLHMAWKGQEADEIGITVFVKDTEDRDYEWSLRFTRDGYDFYVEEYLRQHHALSPPSDLLTARRGEGWWWSGNQKQVELKKNKTTCALTAASADASFPARHIAEFVGRWGFFDPHPFLLRRDWPSVNFDGFDHYGRNLAETLFNLQNSSPELLEKIVAVTRSITGLPSTIETRESENRRYFVQREPGLNFPVHQMGTSSGTLRLLALMTAIFAQLETNLIGIEKPENYVHPTALASLVQCFQKERHHVQFLLTTHSSLLLDLLDEPEAIRIVRRHERNGTSVTMHQNPSQIRKALDETGFGLGEFYETQGFGGN